MRKFLSGGVAVLALALTGATALQAADLPSSATPTARKPIAAVYSWQGFYVGGNIGYSWGPWDSTGAVTSPTGSHKASVDGWIGGFQVGHNWQSNKDWVVGLEGDFQWSGEKNSFAWTFPVVIGDNFSGLNIAETWKLKWLATLRGRVGMTPAPDTLIYLTGGAAVGKVSYSLLATLGAVSLNFSDEKTKWGWTIGGGAEKMLDKNWSAKLEYLYVDLGKYTFVNTFADTKLRDHIVRIGVNYKFGR